MPKKQLKIKKKIEKKIEKIKYWLVNLEDKEIMEFSSDEKLIEWLSGCEKDWEDTIFKDRAKDLRLFVFTSPPVLPYVAATFALKLDKI